MQRNMIQNPAKIIKERFCYGYPPAFLIGLAEKFFQE